MLEAAIVGAGPYGLSISAHFRHAGIVHRTYGHPMDSWIAHMPKGMLLKSDGFASNICDPQNSFTLKQFCAERGIEYADMGTPVCLETFAAYGRAFCDRLVPDLQRTLVQSLEPTGGGFALKLEDGSAKTARRVVVAVGITHFCYVPETLRHLPPEFLSHSFQVSEPQFFSGRSVAIIGAGSSAIDLAGLLCEAGADVHLIAREKDLRFHQKMDTDKPRSLWQQARSPLSGLGPGLRSRFFANAPGVFHYLPESYRLRTTRTFLGPAGGWFAKDKVVGKVPLVLGFAVKSAEIVDHRVCLHLQASDGTERQIFADHVVAATGYKVDLRRLTFLSPSLRDGIKTAGAAPVLSASFESSVPGIYFVGLAAANSFGPVMRFAYGAAYTARRLAEALT